MTYREWMKATVSRFQIAETEVDLILTNQAELIPDPEAQVDVRTAKTALCREFATIIPLANVTEGGYSISWNIEAVKLWYLATCAELGLQNVTKPKIRNKSYLW